MHCMHFDEDLAKTPYSQWLQDSFMRLNNLRLQQNDIDNNMLLG